MNMNNKSVLKVYLTAVAIATILTGNCSGMLDVPNPNAPKGPGLTVTSASSAYSVSEANGTLDLMIVLNTKPTDDVTIPVSSSSTKDATLSVPSLTFTSGNWNKPQTITITGVDNFIKDGNRNISLVFGVAVSADKNYTGGVNPAVAITVIDNETVGVVVTPTGGFIISEVFGTAAFAAVLSSQPTADVSFTVASSSTPDATMSVSNLTFTSSNWNVPQVLTITGVDNFIIDGNRTVLIQFGSVVSGDPLYSGMAIASISGTVVDNETYSITVSPTTLMTTEVVNANTPTGVFNTATFYVALSTIPAADVVLPSITSMNTAEGTLDKSTLTFTSANWNIPQAVTVTGINDGVVDGNKTYNIVFGATQSTDAGYSGMAIANVVVTNLDAQPLTGSILVTPLSMDLVEATPTECLTSAWGNCTGTFSVVLSSPPTANVTIAVTSGTIGRATVDKSLLTFTTGNWSTVQVVTVSTVDNLLIDPVTPVTIDLAPAVSADSNYSGKDPANVAVNIDDNDSYGIRVSNMSRVTMEATPPSTTNGQNATFQVKLNKQPATGTSVTIPIKDTYDIKNYQHKEGIVDKTTLTFTDVNWNTPQTVTVTPVNDFVKDGDIQYVIALDPVASTDANYNHKNPRDVTVINMNKDIAGFHVQTNGSTTSSNMTSGNQTFSGFVTDDMNNLTADHPSFSINLRSKPLSNVTLNLASNSTHNDGILSTSSLIFTPSNWSTAQTVTVAGASDATNEGNHTYLINSAISTTDSVYSNVALVGKPSFNINSCDNDVNNLIVDCMRSGDNMTTTTEGGGTASFWLVTKFIPSSDVTVGLTSNDTTEGSVLTPVTITSANYNTLIAAASNQVVVTGVDDFILDGTINYQVTPAASNGGLTYTIPLPYNLSNLDNEVRYVTSVTGNSTETQFGSPAVNGVPYGQATINVTLGASVVYTSDVTMAVACTDLTECASVSPTSLTFNAGNFSSTQQITVTGADDLIADGNVSSNISFTVTSADPIFSGQNFSVAVTNLDNENPAKAIYVTASTFVGELGGGGISAADSLCNGSDANKPGSGTFKAFLVDIINRVATTSGTDSTGQIGWVLLPNTQYYLSPVSINDNFASSSHLFTTDANGLFLFGIQMTHPFSTNGADTFWTGMNVDMKTMPVVSNSPGGNDTTNNCVDWTFNSDPNSPYYDYYGRYGAGNVTTSAAISSGTGACGPAVPPNPANGSVQRKLICVQQ